MGVSSPFCAARGLGCNCLFKDNNKGKLSEERRAAITRLEASTTTAVQRDGGERAEEQRKPDAGWAVIKGFRPDE